ncbi:hypothetical protein SAMN06272735_8930 [Streptomyces sp. TLI_55]|uniref:hypothetical protein n=1 Tax=Streptomyces sp. TLI_55 TaxID=1938861 RepID=UPI000BD3FC2A|nr:hypothetical protein [Streptomyces sp. TLI_55]SNX88479.1 hypothetical protein SAMN06272735_8930 [Streptomyces sp. TLI_55]
MRALRIDPDTTVTDIDLPDPGAHAAIRNHLGTTGTVDQGLYHRRALLHIHGEGHARRLGQNITAWALASAWRGIILYPIHGPVVVTGRAQDGELAALGDDLAEHAHSVAQTVRDTLGEWRTRPPASNDAALSELLSYAARDVGRAP